MIWIKLITILLAGALNSLGGFHWLFCRRFIMPFILGVSVSVICHTWWLGITVLPVMGTLCMGYFGTGNAGRALWLFLQAVVIGLDVMITGHLAWYFYLFYIVSAGMLGGLYKNWNQIYGDLVSGMWLGSFIIFVR